LRKNGGERSERNWIERGGRMREEVKRKFGLKRKSEQKCEWNWLNKEVQRSEPLQNCLHYNAMKFTVVLSFTGHLLAIVLQIS